MKIINTIISRLEEIIVSIALAIATIITFIEVVLRYGFGSSLGITQELAIYLLILTGMIGASIGVREKTHIGVDIIVKNFPPKLQKFLIVTGFTVSAVFCAVFTYLGYIQARVLADFGQVTPEMEIPRFIPYAIVPLAFALMTLRFLQEAVKRLKLPPGEDASQKEGDS